MTNDPVTKKKLEKENTESPILKIASRYLM